MRCEDRARLGLLRPFLLHDLLEKNTGSYFDSRRVKKVRRFLKRSFAEIDQKAAYPNMMDVLWNSAMPCTSGKDIRIK